jgi:UDP-N-acetylglucosamine--N-acetylmuramyl-(pentapeptide) pyrophosphoryl-undecaprenol N-acetylglucosamine transferase
MGSTRDRSSPHVLLAGGGSGGHVFPALCLAEELLDRGFAVSYAGSAQGLEARLAGDRGIPFHDLSARPLVGRGLAGKARAVATLGRSAWVARGLIRRQAVDAVVGTGGYVSAPAVAGAWLARRPSLLLEPNAHAGVANRWLSRCATEAAVAYQATVKELSCPTRVTGSLVRREFFRTRPLDAAREPLRLLVLGGSLGALQLNRVVPPAVAAAAERLGGLAVTHQCGSRHLEATREAYAAALADSSGVSLEIVPFLEDVASAMEVSHLIVSRAGATTLAEICAVGRPSVLVPLQAALGHQRDNAAVSKAAGAAELLEGEAVTAEALADRLTALLGDRDRLSAMAAAARGLAREDAAERIADRVAALAAGGLG